MGLIFDDLILVLVECGLLRSKETPAADSWLRRKCLVHTQRPGGGFRVIGFFRRVYGLLIASGNCRGCAGESLSLSTF